MENTGKVIKLEEQMRALNDKVETVEKKLEHSVDKLEDKIEDGFNKITDQLKCYVPRNEYEIEMENLRERVSTNSGDKKWVVRIILEAVIVAALAFIFSNGI